MNLTDDQHAYVAQRASWYFECDTAPLHTTSLLDCVIFTGQGLDDLNRTIRFVNDNSSGLQRLAKRVRPLALRAGR